MLLRTLFLLLTAFVYTLSNAQKIAPRSSFDKTLLSSSCVVTELPADKPDTAMHIHAEPEEPEGNNRYYKKNRRHFPGPGHEDYFEDAGIRAMNKTNAGDLALGKQTKFTIYTQGTPPDNTTAISNAGKSITAINVKIGFFDSTGTRLTADKDIATFINDPLISNGNLFDPRVIYDPKADRYIFVVLNGSTTASSKIVIGFSQTNNPIGAWKFYKIAGNIDGNNSWFDYPNIAISDSDLIISGNLFFETSNTFDEAVVLQFNKWAGYNGAATLNFKKWDQIYDADNNLAITIVPASNAVLDAYGPKTYLISNNGSSGNVLSIYELNGFWNKVPGALTLNPVYVSPYSTPLNDAQQKGNGRRLDIKKNRIRSTYFANGILHYAYITPTSAFGAVSAIAYGRYDVSTKSNTMTYIGATGFNYAFPAIMHFSNLDAKNNTLITFLASNNTIYPEVRALMIDEKMQASASIQVKAGDSYVNYGIGNNERWGDYTGIARKYNSVNPEVWVFGCYGETNNRWGNYLAQITAQPDLPPPPSASPDTFYFAPNPTVNEYHLYSTTQDTADFRIQFYDETGKLVREETFEMPKGNHLKTFDLKGMAIAEYIVVLYKNDKKVSTKRMVLIGK